eukprot:CAMPEP_0172488838 /NCGR_PEP_ID=MMETSP1066-20121228/18551_1 /TAXON_ID=671091 /ORGANISM="Coscinodiscus wailesii, Strain CCMP2513" /LENGTH=367 /DNA_ID=CAMNT_0013256311 /DNA_START=330 /DNA_END=1433 /DNA_ORIENTATION=-
MTADFYGRSMSYVVEVSILIFCLGAAIAYIVAVGDILEEGVLNVFDHPSYVTRDFLIVIFFTFVMLPLSLFERVDSLRFSSLFGLLSIFFLVLSIMVHSIRYMSTTGFELSWEQSGVVLFPASALDFFRACPLIIFAFSCHVNVPQIFSELVPRSVGRMNVTTRCGVGVCNTSYLLIGVFGYLNFGKHTSDNVLKNYCVSKETDYMIVAAFICITIAITMAYPLCILPSRVTIEIMLMRFRNDKNYLAKQQLGDDDEDLVEPLLEDDNDYPEISTNRRVLLTIAIAGFSLFVALVIPDVSIIFGLTGGSAVGLVSFIMPGLFMLKAAPERRNVMAWAMIIGGTVISLLGTSVTVYDIFNDEQVQKIC